MTLDEAIIHCEEVRKFKNIEGVGARIRKQDKYADECFKYANEYQQIADWLKILKRILNSGDCNDCALLNSQCRYAPGWGKQVRFNCPFYSKEGNK